jgi:hypothetical protein
MRCAGLGQLGHWRKGTGPREREGRLGRLGRGAEGKGEGLGWPAGLVSGFDFLFSFAFPFLINSSLFEFKLKFEFRHSNKIKLCTSTNATTC